MSHQPEHSRSEEQPHHQRNRSLISAASLRAPEERSWESPFEEDSSGSVSGDDHLGFPSQSRRSSSRFAPIREAGGVNSFQNFARSWSRAAAFHEIVPPQHTFRIVDDGSVESGSVHQHESDVESAETMPLLTGDVASNGTFEPGSAIPVLPRGHYRSSVESRHYPTREDLLHVEPSLNSTLGGCYGTSYSSTHARRRSSLAHPAQVFRRGSQGSQPVLSEEDGADESEQVGESREPVVIKQVEDSDGGKYAAVVGRSTLPQTIFNSVNVLIGIGLLSLPLAFKYCGWVIGVSFFVTAVLMTRYTALLLAKCLDRDNSLVTFADLAYVSYGNKARVATSVLFTMDLTAACVALIVLFGDSLDALVPGHGVVVWKCLCGLILVPLGFLPLRLLSFTSVLGIISCFAITATIFMAGIFKRERPGSLLHPARTYAWPEHWGMVLLGFGLLMSPWGGHTVFPNIYRDMRHPYKYRRGVNVTYIFTFCLDLSMAVIGLLMFGDDVLDEITSNMLLTEGYPSIVGLIIVTCVAIIPLTKVPLTSRPILATVETFMGIHPSKDPATNAHGLELGAARVKTRRQWQRGAVNVGTTLALVGIAIAFPSFDRIMALLGSVCCFGICVILPLLFHLKLFASELSKLEVTMSWIAIGVSLILATGSTITALLPREAISPPK